jgi:fucose permease
MAVGRVVLGFATERYGERWSVTVYLAFAVALELVFRIMSSIAISLVTVAFLGFFLGPLFPSGVVMVARLLPKHLHVSALAIAAAIGQIGGAFSPFVVGALTQHWGVQIFQLIIFGLLLLVLLSWLSFPRLETDEVQGCSETEIQT